MAAETNAQSIPPEQRLVAATFQNALAKLCGHDSEKIRLASVELKLT